MSDKLEENAEQVSALVDGQLRGDEFARAIAHLEADDAARATWDTYHLVGEAMRSTAVPLHAHDAQFVQRLRHKISTDTLYLIASEEGAISATGQNVLKVPVANEGRWRRVVGLASVAVVGILAWQAYLLTGTGGVLQATPQLAQAPAQAVSSGTPTGVVAADTANGSSAVMLRDPRLDAMLAAHRQLGGAGALQMSSGFLRNATFNEGNR